MVRTIGPFYPALLTLAALAGLTACLELAPSNRAAALGSCPGLFTSFEFSDQLVWGWVVGLALCLLPLPRGRAQTAGANLLLVWAVLYAVRGLAVFFAGSRRVPALVIADAYAGGDVSVAVCPGRAHPAGSRRYLARLPAPAAGVGYLREVPMIEVILREDIKTLGRAGEMVQVKPGYARNYLLPQGLAYEATEGNKKRIAAEGRVRAAATRPSGPRPSGWPPPWAGSL